MLQVEKVKNIPVATVYHLNKNNKIKNDPEK